MNRINIQIDIDRLNILSCTKEDIVFLQTDYTIYDDSNEKNYNPIEADACVCITTRETLHDMIDTWLDGKAGYYERGSGFAGVGYIEVEKYEELPENERCHLNIFHGESDDEDDWYVEEKIVRTFLILDYDMQMEHG